MADSEVTGVQGGEQEAPVFQIQRIYLKDMSLEQPNSPTILLETQQPAVDIQLGVDAQPAAQGVFEVCVTATVTTKIEDRTVFLVEAKQAGIFEIRNLPPEQMSPVLGIACPKSSIPTCAPAWLTSSPALVSRLCIWQKLISKRCLKPSRLRPPGKQRTDLLGLLGF